MNPRVYLILTGCIFTVVGVGHLLRLLFAMPIEVGGWTLPMWISWLGFPAALALAVWAFRLARRAS
jgi:hypothetical protein